MRSRSCTRALSATYRSNSFGSAVRFTTYIALDALRSLHRFSICDGEIFNAAGEKGSSDIWNNSRCSIRSSMYWISTLIPQRISSRRTTTVHNRRKSLINQKQFRTAKQIRRMILGRLCENCQERLADVGHHVYSKARSGVLEIQMRCTQCEVICHQQAKDGNPSWSRRIHQKNNELISSYFQTHPS